VYDASEFLGAPESALDQFHTDLPGDCSRGKFSASVSATQLTSAT
jgi:hypothetical protein